MSPNAVRSWSWVHKWTSLVCTAFLFMLCVTGLPLIFGHEIDDALGHDRWQPANPGGPLLSYDQILKIALDARPGETPLFMSFDTDRPVVNVTTGPTADAPGSKMHFASFDRTSGDLVPQVADGGVMEFLLQLHTDMFLGLGGMLFLGTMGVLFVAAIVSGVVIYGPFMRRLPFGALRLERSARVKWLDYHNLLGIVTAAWVLVVGVTGVINTLAVPILAYWKNTELASLTATYDGRGPVAARASLDEAIERAQVELPGMELQFVAFPGGSYSTDRHYAVFFHGASPLTSHLTTPALIEADTGRFTASVPSPWYVKTLALSQPLHFGDYGGLPLKILWGLLDLFTVVVLGSGLYLWLAKRRPARASAPAAAPVLAPAE